MPNPRVTRCSHCQDLDTNDKGSMQAIGRCKKLGWYVGQVGRKQALCDERQTEDELREEFGELAKSMKEE